MATPTVLVSTWSDGVFALVGDAHQQELAGRAVNALAPDGRGSALAILDGHTLCRRAAAGQWDTLATTQAALACCVAVGDLIYLGTDDARILRFDAQGELTPLPGFDTVAGRDQWYGGQALVDDRLVGPPLGVRSITATSDGAVLLANVHVGGIPRSTDGGNTWHPTIPIDTDVHEVRAHPTRSDVVIAASAVGLCTSHNSGATWTLQREGLHAPYCSAVAFLNDDILVAASADHFAPRGALYRRPLDTPGPLVKVSHGLPHWLAGIADTRQIATHGASAAIADKEGNVYVSTDARQHWTRCASDLPSPSSVLIV